MSTRHQQRSIQGNLVVPIEMTVKRSAKRKLQSISVQNGVDLHNFDMFKTPRLSGGMPHDKNIQSTKKLMIRQQSMSPSNVYLNS